MNIAIEKLNQAVESCNLLNFEDNSVYTGLSGIAFAYLRIYENTANSIYLDKSEYLINISLKNLSRDRVSFLCGDAGPLTIAAYISHLKKNFDECKKLIER